MPAWCLFLFHQVWIFSFEIEFLKILYRYSFIGYSQNLQEQDAPKICKRQSWNLLLGLPWRLYLFILALISETDPQIARQYSNPNTSCIFFTWNIMSFKYTLVEESNFQFMVIPSSNVIVKNWQGTYHK